MADAKDHHQHVLELVGNGIARPSSVRAREMECRKRIDGLVPWTRRWQQEELQSVLRPSLPPPSSNAVAAARAKVMAVDE